MKPEEEGPWEDLKNDGNILFCNICNRPVGLNTWKDDDSECFS